MELRSLSTRLFELGTRPALAPPLRGRIILTNQIAAIVVVIALVALITSDGPRANSLGYGYLLLATVAIGVPWLNAMGHTTASRLVLVVCPPVMLIGAGVLGGASDLGFVMALPYALIAISLLPLLLFHTPSERLPRRIGVAFVGSLLLGYDWLLAGALADENRLWLEAIRSDTKVAQMMLWALVVVSVQFALHADSYGTPERRRRPAPDASG